MPQTITLSKFTVITATLLVAACAGERTTFPDRESPEASTSTSASSIDSQGGAGAQPGASSSASDSTSGTETDDSTADDSDDADDSGADDKDDSDDDAPSVDDSSSDDADDDATPSDDTSSDNGNGDDSDPDVDDSDATDPDDGEPDQSDPDVSDPDVSDPDVTETDDTDPEDTSCVVVGGCEGETPVCNTDTGECVTCLEDEVTCTESGLLATCNADNEWEEEMCDDATPYCVDDECMTCDPEDPSSCEVDLCMGKVCTASDQCHKAGVCDPGTGECSAPAANNGTDCDDDDACTQTDKCQAGECVGSSPKLCTASDQCHKVGVCDPDTGNCSNPNADANTECDDGQFCTEDDVCTAGVCGGEAKVCDDPPACKQSTNCSAGACNYTQNVPDGTADAKCPAGTGYCLTGSCVKCASDAQCSGSTPSCRPLDHTCTCRLPSDENLLVNPGFDGSFVGWTTTDCTLTTDSESCSGSKAAIVTSGCQPSQCVPVSNGTYFVGAKFKQDTNPGAAHYFQLVFYSDDDCTDDVGADGSPEGAATTSWTILKDTINVPSGVHSAMVQIWCNQAQVDQVYFGTSDQF